MPWQKIKHEPGISEVAWEILLLVAHAGEIWGKPVLLRVGPTYTLEMPEGILM